MIEYWADVVGYERLYQVSSWGRVRSVSRITWDYDPRWGQMRSRRITGKIIKRQWSPYVTVGLRKGAYHRSFGVHRLVLKAFVGPCPEGMEACHNNGDAWDNRLENLRWDTRKNNHQDKIKHGTTVRGEQHPMSISGRMKRCEAARLLKSGSFTLNEIVHATGLSAEVVERIKTKNSDIYGRRKDNRFLTAFNQRKTQTEWSKLSGLSVQLIGDRITRRRMSIEDALTTPNRSGRCLKEVPNFME